MAENPRFIEENLNDICASIQEIIVTILLKKLRKAARETGIKEVAIAGGVSANSGLRRAFLALGEKEGWNTYRIICRGPEITLFINGTLMCQFTDRDAKQAASKGIIALQMHPGPPMKIEFKNLRLKTL